MLVKPFLIFLIIVLCFSCQGKSVETNSPAGTPAIKHFPPDAQPLILSILPIESPKLMYEKFLPLKYYLEKELNMPIVIKIAKDYETAIEEIGRREVHLAYIDPAAYCEIRAKYKNNIIPLVKPQLKELGSSRSVLITKDSNKIDRLIDVRGKRLALGNKQSSFSYLIPLAMLNDVGITQKDFSIVDYLKQEDRVALSILIGNHDVGGISESVAKRYLPDGIKIIKKSDEIPQFLLVASDILPKDKIEAVIQSLVSLKYSHVLASIDKNIEGFVQAQDRDFDIVRIMIKNLTGKNYIEYGNKTIKFAVLPLYPATTIYQRYEGLMRYLSNKTGYEFKLVIPRDFDEFMQVVKSGNIDFSYQNPYIFAMIDKHYDITAIASTLDISDGEAGEGTEFKGVIITRNDSNINNIEDLRNKKVMIVSPKSAGGFLSQKIFLAKRGINVEKELRLIDAKRQEKVILGVYNGDADAGFVREAALGVLKEELDMSKIKILAKTEPLPNWPIASCRKDNPALVKKVTNLLLELKDYDILTAARIRGIKKANEVELDALKQY